MKRIFIYSLALSIALAGFSQKRNLDISGFTKVAFGVPGTVYITQGTKDEVVVDCDDDIFEDLEFNLRGDRLVIENESNWGWNGFRQSELTIHITMREIEALSVSGSGDMISKGKIETDDLRLSVSGSGGLEIDVQANEIDGRISGSGGMLMSGNADIAEISISGSGKMDGEDLEVNTFDATISGSGRCYITVNEEIEANISGSGSVYYSGDPDRVISHASGSGKIRKN